MLHGETTIDLSLIPFGYHAATREFLDVSEVPRGKQCGCVCPSCKTPLIARHGTVKEWHYAHASRSVYSQTESDCEFAFYVSVRMMARQLIGDELEIALPAYIASVEGETTLDGGTITVPFTITKAKTVKLQNISVEHSFLGASVDVYGQINGYEFAIYFTHPGRTVPEKLRTPSESKCGIVSVSLDPIPALFKRTRSGGENYRVALSEFLMHDIESKSWVYHPRYSACKKKAALTLERRIAESDTCNSPQERERSLHGISAHAYASEAHADRADVAVNRLAVFECVMCSTTWEGLERSASPCPKCKTHLYRTLKCYVKNAT